MVFGFEMFKVEGAAPQSTTLVVRPQHSSATSKSLSPYGQQLIVRRHSNISTAAKVRTT